MSNNLDSLRASVELSLEIRLVSNRFLLNMLGRVRNNAGTDRAIQADDRILDIGCGDKSYFYKRWRDACSRPGNAEPELLVGIDKKIHCETREEDTTHPFSAEYITEDFFKYNIPAGRKKFNLIYSSFCQPWLLAVPGNQTQDDVDRVDSSFFKKLDELLDDNGMFVAISTYGKDNFPLYTRIILECLKRVGCAKTYEEYTNAKIKPRDNYPHIRDLGKWSIRDTKEMWRQKGYENLLFLRTMEWIPLRRNDEFFQFWDSGGKDLLTGMLGSEAKYNEFRQEFEKIVKSDEALKQLGIRLHTGQDGNKYILLPAHNYYQIARKKGKKEVSIRPSLSLCCHANTRVYAADAEVFQKVLCRIEESSAILNDTELDSKLSEPVVQEASRIAFFQPIIDTVPEPNKLTYAAFVQAGGLRHPGVQLWYYGKKYKNRRPLVEQGRFLELPTVTPGLLDAGRSRAEAKHKNRYFAALFTLIQESSKMSKCIPHFGCAESPGNEHFPVQLLLLPDGALHALKGNLTIDDAHYVSNETARFPVFKNDIGDLNKWDLLDPLLGLDTNERDWPRFLFASEEAELILTEMVRKNAESSRGRECWDWENPLRYYVWQAYSSAPNPLGMVVVPRQNPGDTGVDSSRTGFVGWDATGQTICDGYALARMLNPLLSILLSRSLILKSKALGVDVGRDESAGSYAHELKRVPANLSNLVPDPSAMVNGQPLIQIAKAGNIGQYNSVLDLSGWTSKTGVPRYGTLLLHPDLPSIVRDNMGLCFYSQGVRDIANLMDLWCQAYSNADLRKLLGIKQGEPLGNLKMLLDRVWLCSLRLLPLTGKKGFDFSTYDSKKSNNKLKSELKRFSGIVELADKANLVFRVRGTNTAKCLALDGIDKTAIGWLGRALLAIMRDYTRHTIPPKIIVVHVSKTKQLVGSITNAALKINICVKDVDQKGSVCKQGSITELQNVQNMAKNSELYGMKSGMHTKQVVDFCLTKLDGLANFDDDQYSWNLNFQLKEADK